MKITTSDKAEGITFRLEGQFAGAWVKQLAETWNSAVGCLTETPAWVDLAAVTYIDTTGFAMLTLMARQGATMIAPDSLNHSLVDEIRTSLGAD